MRSLFDLPAHPFFIHLPLVLVPINAIAAVVIACRRTWQRRYAVSLAIAAFVAAVGAVLAARSGEELNEELSSRIGPLAEEHQSLAETGVWLALAFFVASLVVVLVQRMTASETGERVAQGVMMTAAALAIGAAVWIVRAGHEGSRIVWDGVIS
ncbi:MAG: DUF2231 domain-containing protein [Acidimicrobiales bacterium]|nr:DUF2231 domain-containing protein [Acidimicrobiales bacterium]